jgi:hypothetical protein
MNVLMIRSKFKEENVADAQAAIEKVVQALERVQLAGVRYSSARLSDGATFVAFLVLENGEDPLTGNPLRALPEYTELLENLKQWQPEPPTVEQMTVIGSYRLF